MRFIRKPWPMASVFVLLAASPGPAQQAVGSPMLSDGTTSLAVTTDGSGVYSFNACGRDYWVQTDHGYNVYKNMRPNLLKSGYVYYRTTDQYKNYYACGWGIFEHLTDVMQ